VTWRELWTGFRAWWSPPIDVRREQRPPTLAGELSNPLLDRPLLYDPALRPYSALRGGEPRFDSAADEATWHYCRQHVLHHALRRVAGSSVREHLVLRGSVLLASWLGERARRPGDLDFVVDPAHWKFGSVPATQLLQTVIAALEGTVVLDTMAIERGTVATAEIWTYDVVPGAPGVRLVVPWRHTRPQLSGSIQLDFVFGEPLPTPAISTAIQLKGLDPITVRAVTPQQSLAWKLVWLASDDFVMGKDLYDAVLLAEAFGVDPDVLDRTFQSIPERCDPLELRLKEIPLWSPDWSEFQEEYPHISGSANDWLIRLQTALAPFLDR